MRIWWRIPTATLEKEGLLWRGYLSLSLLKPKIQVVKTAYMDVLLNLIETLNKPSECHSETELSNAHSELSELMDVGFKLDWLEPKLDG